MNAGWSGLCVLASVILLVANAERNNSVVEVHRSGIVAIEAQGKTRGHGSRRKLEESQSAVEIREKAQRGGDQAIHEMQTDIHKASPKSHEPSAVVKEPALGNALKEAAVALPSAAVQQAIKALIESSNHQAKVAQQHAQPQDEDKHNNVSHDSSSTVSASSIGASMEPPDQETADDPKHDSPMPRMKSHFAESTNQARVQDSLDVGSSSLAASSNISDPSQPERRDAEGLDASTEGVLTSSTSRPSKAVEELERDSTSILSVVFFTYLLLSLTAFAACVACVMHRKAEECSDELEKQEKWWQVLRYGSFGSAAKPLSSTIVS